MENRRNKGMHYKLPPRTEEYRKKSSEWMRRYGKSEEGMKKIEKMAELRRGQKLTDGHKKKMKKTYEEKREKRLSTFYIINDNIYTLEYLFNKNRRKGIKETETMKEVEGLTPATQEEIEQWLSSHLIDSVYELELMKAETD